MKCDKCGAPVRPMPPDGDVLFDKAQIANTRPQPAPPAGDFDGISLVRQKNPNGCVIASLAMVTGNSYDDILATYPWSHDGCDMETVASDYLYRCGIAWQRIYINQPAPRFENHHRAEWPPKPWAPAHLCMVETSQAHCVVMKSDGTVLDPLTDEPRTLANYRKVMQVWGLYRLGLAARPRVEDAEVTKIANDLREAGKVLDNGVTKILDAGFFVKAADLLERLAGELTEITADRDGWKQQHENLLHVRQTDIENLAAKIERLEAALGKSAIDMGIALHKHGQAEAKLAEREAELAKADAALAIMDDFVQPNINWEEWISDAFEESQARHAARQQQKEDGR